MEISEVDPYDEPTLAAWQRVVERSQAVGRPWARPRRLPEIVAELRAPTSRDRFGVYAGRVDGAVVCAAAMSRSQVDNLTAADLDLDTDPDHRQQGHGTTMLAHLEAVARADGRHLLNIEVHHLLASPPDGRGEADVDFLTRRGFGYGLGNAHRRLAVPLTPGLLDDLAASAAPHHAAYQVVSLAGPVPEEHLASLAVIDASLRL